MKKYEFTGETKKWLGRTLHQIRAVVSFGDVQAGDVGGWIEKEENLSHEGNCWVSGNGRVYGDGQVSGNGWVFCDNHYLVIGPMGSRNDFTTFFRTKDLEIGVTCGCFRGNIEAFAEKVREAHGDNEHAKRYLAAIELAKVCIDLTPEE